MTDNFDAIGKDLWNENPPEVDTTLDQYKLAVQMADAVSHRRGLTNTFFLTFNTAFIGATAALYEKTVPEMLIAFLAAGLMLSGVWANLLYSYRTLNRAKFTVIAAMECRLSAAPYAAEWKAAGEGRDWRKHTPISPVETIVPIIFGFIYVALILIVLTAREIPAP